MRILGSLSGFRAVRGSWFGSQAASLNSAIWEVGKSTR